MDKMSDARFEKFVLQLNPDKNADSFEKEFQEILQNMKKDFNYVEILGKFTALGDQTRWAIYNILKLQPMCTCALAKIFHMKESAISHHLKILETNQLIIGKKEGYFTVYCVKPFKYDI
jgi:predicted transcriptional regulator